MDEFTAVLGGVASALAVAGALTAAWRWTRAQRQRRILRRVVHEAQATADVLISTVTDIDHRMSEGVGWAGWAIWPKTLAPHLFKLEEVMLELEATAARVRGLDAEARLERLRADVEACCLLLHRAAEIYRSGSISNYRRIEESQYRLGRRAETSQPRYAQRTSLTYNKSPGTLLI